LLIEETGSVFMKAPWEVSYAIECLRVAAGCIRQPHGDTFPASAAGQVGMTIRQPLGVIAGIAPFNSPFLLAMKKVAFALAAGNTFILKPSDLAPLSGLKIAEVFAAAGCPPACSTSSPVRPRWWATSWFPTRASDDHLHRLEQGRPASRRGSRQAHEARHARDGRQESVGGAARMRTWTMR
jgi:hypothetical protein